MKTSQEDVNGEIISVYRCAKRLLQHAARHAAIHRTSRENGLLGTTT